VEQRKPSAKHRGWSREWSISPVRLLAGDPVQAQLEDGTWVSGTLHPVRGGLEIEYEEARAAGQGCVESSRLLDHEAARRLRMLVRPEPLWTDSVRVRRETQIWQAAHPPWHVRLGQWTRELCRRDPLAAEPLLRRHLGRRVIVDVRRGPRTLFAAGVLLAYDRDFLALADTILPAETSLPLCPGRMSGAGLDILWNDDGLELFNREKTPVDVLGLRSAEGFRTWELRLKPGQRQQYGLPRAPAGTAELVFESPVSGDAVLPRSLASVRGASEGSVSIPGLPDLSTRVGELAAGPAGEEVRPPLVKTGAPQQD
jgi:hypothetical protein